MLGDQADYDTLNPRAHLGLKQTQYLPSFRTEVSEAARTYANLFVKAKHVLDGIHEDRFAVLIAIASTS